VKNINELDRRAQKAMMRSRRGAAGLCFSADPKRQVVHLAIHDGAQAGSAITLDADAFEQFVRSLLAVEIDTLEERYDRIHSPATRASKRKREEKRQLRETLCAGGRVTRPVPHAAPERLSLRESLRIPPYSDATALVLVRREERAA
jgi:hypothetical protein